MSPLSGVARAAALYQQASQVSYSFSNPGVEAHYPPRGAMTIHLCVKRAAQDVGTWFRAGGVRSGGAGNRYTQSCAFTAFRATLQTAISQDERGKGRKARPLLRPVRGFGPADARPSLAGKVTNDQQINVGLARHRRALGSKLLGCVASGIGVDLVAQ